MKSMLTKAQASAVLVALQALEDCQPNGIFINLPKGVSITASGSVIRIENRMDVQTYLSLRQFAQVHEIEA